jgi:hypothetical protein
MMVLKLAFYTTEFNYYTYNTISKKISCKEVKEEQPIHKHIRLVQ